MQFMLRGVPSAGNKEKEEIIRDHIMEKSYFDFIITIVAILLREGRLIIF